MKPWKTKEWKDKRKEFIKDKQCEWCGSTKNLRIHHPQKRNSLSNKQYFSFIGVRILCSKCHFASHRGYVLCQKCKTNYHKPRYNTCFKCSGLEEKWKKYTHPWCNKEFNIDKEDWEFHAEEHMCCIEECDEDPNCCDIANKLWDSVYEER